METTRTYFDEDRDKIVPPSGGSLEIGNSFTVNIITNWSKLVPPSGGSLEIGNFLDLSCRQ